MSHSEKSLIEVNIVEEMQTAYLDYAMAVIVGRALPSLYDGLKPVTRRVLVSMHRLGLKPDARYMKCARVEGETMGRFHPHGGAYGALITAAQTWTNNHALIDVHGNMGPPTDNCAASEVHRMQDHILLLECSSSRHRNLGDKTEL